MCVKISLLIALTSLLAKPPLAASRPVIPDLVTEQACQTLHSKFPGDLYWSASSEYEFQRTDFWSNTTFKTPQCIFAPSDAQAISTAVRVLRNAETKFAVRAVGHMPNPGFNSIDDGVLIVLSKLRQIRIANDLSAVSIGPGLNAGEVYSYLDRWGRVTALARYAPVGVAGMLLGGGISHFNGKNGWAANNVLQYEIVTANGDILNVNRSSHSDLFWALKGGANNYGIVTQFTLKTFHVPQVYAGNALWSAPNVHTMSSAVKAFISPGGGITDNDTSISPIWSVVPATGTTTGSVTMVHAGNESSPWSLRNFTRTANNNTAHVRTYKNFMPETVAYANGTVRDSFASVALRADPDAVQLFLDILTPLAISMLRNVTDAYVGFAPQPVSVSWLQAAQDSGGYAIDLDPANGDFFLLLVAVEWSDAKDDATVTEFNKQAIESVHKQALAKGLSYPFIYLNDASFWQKPLNLYGGGKSLERMKAIRAKYDPASVFQELMPGGFKLPR